MELQKTPTDGRTSIGETSAARTPKHSSTEELTQAKHLDFAFTSRPVVLVPEGERFEAGFVTAERGRVCGQEKIFLWFRLTTPGEHFGKELFMSCKFADGGRWGLSSKFYQAWMLASGVRPARTEVHRLSTRIFCGLMFRVKTQTVMRNYLHELVPLARRYSVIERLLEVTAGAPAIIRVRPQLQKIGSLHAPKKKEV